MLARLAKRPDVARLHARCATPALAVSNNNQVDERPARTSQRRRPALLCRWRVEPGGKLICGWEIDENEAAPPIGSTPQIKAVRLAGGLGAIILVAVVLDTGDSVAGTQRPATGALWPQV
jgi:hypothetical protein